MGTGTSRARAQPSNSSSDPGQPANSTSRSGGGGSSERTVVDVYDEWLLSWLASLPPPETYEEEDDDDDDDKPPAGEGGEGTASGTTSGDTPSGEPPASGSAPTTSAPAQPRLPKLKVTRVRLNALSNSQLHETHDYEYDRKVGRELIVRRGQMFKIVIHLSRPFKEKKERIYLQFSANVKVPKPMDGTLISIDINGTYKDDDWSAKMDAAEDNEIKVTVKSAPNAIVGSYKLAVKVKSRASGMETIFQQDKKIMVLFNPWCEKDAVYMENKDERQEYVLEDSGSIWRGNANSNRPKPWTFGQFDLDVYRVVFALLDEHVKFRDRRTPVKVSRDFSFLVNDKILWGNWSGDYSDGTRPTKWKGSVKIIEEYAKSKESVKFGQCWVFSGLLTTFLRCVGIPARSVTNFDSAHDTEDNMTIDKYEDREGNKLTNINKDRTGGDSVWNFHVWNEAWMTRPDLDPGFGGWQAVDSTPQELSAGKYQCGPAPVIAVKRGMVNQGYDTRFVFAEVNADEAKWRVTPYPNHREGLDFTLLRLNTRKAGHNITTKRVGAENRDKNGNDITLEYKYSEGSAEERAAVETAVSKGINRGMYDMEGEPDDVIFDFIIKDDLWIGRPFDVEIEAKNISNEARDVQIKTEIDSCDSRGTILDTIKIEKMKITIQGNESVTSTIHVEPKEYEDKMEDEGLFAIFVIANVGFNERTGESKSIVTNQHNIRLKQPDLEVTADVTGAEVNLKVEFENPLDHPLTNCEFQIEAPKLVRPFTHKIDDIGAKEKVQHTIKFTARSSGKKTVIVELDTKQLKDIDGSVKIEVKLDENEEDD